MAMLQHIGLSVVDIEGGSRPVDVALVMLEIMMIRLSEAERRMPSAAKAS